MQKDSSQNVGSELWRGTVLKWSLLLTGYRCAVSRANRLFRCAAAHNVDDVDLEWGWAARFPFNY